ncbi:MAG: hypothetical protein AAF651_05200 [Cyanobacteria bacterium P01_C01_bin.73]
MSDTSTFLAGCATTGMAALLLVLARVSLDESAPAVPDGPPTTAVPEVISQVPPPPPTTVLEPDNLESDQRDRSERQLQREIDRQQTLAQRLEDQLEEQTLLIRDLEDQLERQENERAEILARLDEQQRSLDGITEQQRRLNTLERSPGDAQTIMVWVGAGFFVAIIGVGGLALVGILIMMSQSPRRSPRPSEPPLIYPPAPPAYRYYDQDFLPPPQLRPYRSAAPYPSEEL